MADEAPVRSAWRSEIDRIKLERGCEDPGCKGYPKGYPRVLSFDHRVGFGNVKLFELSQAVRGKGRSGRFVRPGADGINVEEKITWGLIVEEIAKCDVVCKNCHEVRNTERTKGKRARPDPPDLSYPGGSQ
jgi:hypothetical protein